MGIVNFATSSPEFSGAAIFSEPPESLFSGRPCGDADRQFPEKERRVIVRKPARKRGVFRAFCKRVVAVEILLIGVGAHDRGDEDE